MSTKRVSIGDISLNVYDAGTGRPVLFVHGFPLSHAMWRAQLDHLAGDYRVIAPDLRGFGASDASDATVTMERMADDCSALLDALAIDDRIVLCGLSMGGYVAWQFVRKHADRLRGLILCDTKSAADTLEAQTTRLKMAQQVLSTGAEEVARAMLPKIFAKETFERQPHVVDEVRRMIARNRAAGIAAAQRGMAARHDAGSILPTIRAPTLVLVGEHDAISPVEEMRAIAHAIPHARFEIIRSAGHMAPMEAPSEVNRVMTEFLAELDRG